MERKWTFFISSTLEDLREERQAVANQLLKMEEIPIGMEQFGAIDKSSWENIERFIDSADYYILIIAGKYGSTDGSLDGMSFTEREYRYAKSKGIPVIAVLHGDPSSLPGKFYETDALKREKLDNFRNEVKHARLVAFYRNIAELIGEVSAAVGKAKQRFPRPGWVRHGEGTGSEATEIKRLRSDLAAKEIELQRAYAHAQTVPLMDDTDSSGNYQYAVPKLKAEVKVILNVEASGVRYKIELDMKWQDLFYKVARGIERRVMPMFDLRDAVTEQFSKEIASPLNGGNATVMLDHDFSENMQYVFESLKLVSFSPADKWVLTRLGRRVYVDWRAERAMGQSRTAIRVR